MKSLCAVMSLMVSGWAVPAFAADGRVPASALAGLGLGGLRVVSDSEGMQVRGMSSSASASGASLLFAQLRDPFNPGNFFIASDTNGGAASDQNAGLSVDSLATQGPQGSSIVGTLDIQSGNPAIQVFLGMFTGNAGNAANLGAAGLSAATGN